MGPTDTHKTLRCCPTWKNVPQRIQDQSARSFLHHVETMLKTGCLPDGDMEGEGIPRGEDEDDADVNEFTAENRRRCMISSNEVLEAERREAEETHARTIAESEEKAREAKKQGEQAVLDSSTRGKDVVLPIYAKYEYNLDRVVQEYQANRDRSKQHEKPTQIKSMIDLLRHLGHTGDMPKRKDAIVAALKPLLSAEKIRIEQSMAEAGVRAGNGPRVAAVVGIGAGMGDIAMAEVAEVGVGERVGEHAEGRTVREMDIA